jgi:hypothetical protein
MSVTPAARLSSRSLSHRMNRRCSLFRSVDRCRIISRRAGRAEWFEWHHGIQGISFGLRATLQPSEHLLCVPVVWEYRIENVLNSAVADNEREAFQQTHRLHVKRRQPHRRREFKLGIAEQRERQV